MKNNIVTIEVNNPFPTFRNTKYFINGEHVATVGNRLKREGNVMVIISTSISVLSDSFSESCFVTI